MNTLRFKPEFEAKLKKLKIKTKFVKERKAHLLAKKNGDETRRFVNQIVFEGTNNWRTFINNAFDWSRTADGDNFWEMIFEK